MPSIRSFVSRLSVSLLTRFLNMHEVALEPDTLNATSAKIADAIEARLLERGPGARGRLLNDIEMIDRFAGESGQLAVTAVTLDDEIADLSSAHDRALWLYLTDKDRFSKAEDILYTDERRYGRQWNAFCGPRGVDLRNDAEAMEAFKASLRMVFDSENVHVDIFERSRPEFSDTSNGEDDGAASLTQITIYREGRPNAENVFVDGALTTQTRCPVIEAAITYEAATGTIECVSAERKTREDVVRSFGITMLGFEEDFQPQVARAYDLTVLQERLDFSTEPSDGIEDVSVSMLRLHPVDSSGERITVEKVGATDRDIWTVVDERLGRNALVSDYRIGQARIVIRYKAGDSNRLRSLPITMTHPDRSSIKEQREIERLIAHKYLPRWGLVPG